jgi:hypothetical protein
MKWTYSVKNKLVASGALLSLCILVLISNYIDRNHTNKVKNAIGTLYKDRLIAEEYILKMTSGVYQVKEVINAETNDSNKTNSINNLLLNIREESSAYQKTKFTEVEKRKADELLKVLREFEDTPTSKKQLQLKHTNKALILLNELSVIQLEESKQIMEHAETLYLSGKASSQFVFAIILVILLVLQSLVFASKTLRPNIKSRYPHLN